MKARHVVLLLLALGVLWVARFLFVSDEARIRGAVEDMLEAAERSGTEQQVVAYGRARDIAAHFADGAVATDRTRGESVRGRDGILQAVAWARETYERGRFAAQDLEVDVGDGVASSRFVLRMLEDDVRGRWDGTRVELSWREEGGDWRIVEARVETPPD